MTPIKFDFYCYMAMHVCVCVQQICAHILPNKNFVPAAEMSMFTCIRSPVLRIPYLYSPVVTCAAYTRGGNRTIN